MGEDIKGGSSTMPIREWLKSWVSHLTNNMMRMNLIYSFGGYFPNLFSCPCATLLHFHVCPPLLTLTVWANELSLTDIHFTSSDIGEEVRFHGRQWSPFYPFSKIFNWFPIPSLNGSILLGYIIPFWTSRLGKKGVLRWKEPIFWYHTYLI